MSRPPTTMGNYKQVNPRPMKPELPRPKLLERVEIPDPPLPPESPKLQPPRLIKEGNVLQAFAPSLTIEELSKIPELNLSPRFIDYSKNPPTQYMISFIKNLLRLVNREKSFEYKIVKNEYDNDLHVLSKKWFTTKWRYIDSYHTSKKDEAEYVIKMFFEYKEQEMIAANEKRFTIDHSKKKQSGGLSVIDNIDNGQLYIVDNEEKSIDNIDLLILQKIKNADLEAKEQIIKEIKKIKRRKDLQ